MIQAYGYVKGVLTTPFTLFDKKHSRIWFAGGLFLFSVLFLCLFVPFDISRWIAAASPVRTLMLPMLGVMGGVLILASQGVQSRLFAGKGLKCYHLVCGFVLDCLFATVPLSILYADPAYGYPTEFLETLKMVSLMLLVGYGMGIPLLALRQAKLDRGSQTKSSAPAKLDPRTDRVAICDENGQLRLSISRADLLFFEAADNYVVVYYRNEQRVGKEIVRTTLKNLEADFASCHCLRCHRSYMVNLQNVSCVRKDGRSYEIAIRGTLLKIPVSRSYVKEIREILKE